MFFAQTDPINHTRALHLRENKNAGQSTSICATKMEDRIMNVWLSAMEKATTKIFPKMKSSRLWHPGRRPCAPLGATKITVLLLLKVDQTNPLQPNINHSHGGVMPLLCVQEWRRTRKVLHGRTFSKILERNKDRTDPFIRMRFKFWLVKPLLNIIKNKI